MEGERIKKIVLEVDGAYPHLITGSVERRETGYWVRMNVSFGALTTHSEVQFCPLESSALSYAELMVEHAKTYGRAVAMLLADAEREGRMNGRAAGRYEAAMGAA
jgi:hypothetical protein